MVPMTQYESDLQDFVKFPSVPAEVMTPPPFTPSYPFEPKEYLTPPPYTSPTEFYELYLLDDNGIEEPVTSISQLMPLISQSSPVIPQQKHLNQIDVSNKITKMFPVR